MTRVFRPQTKRDQQPKPEPRFSRTYQAPPPLGRGTLAFSMPSPDPTRILRQHLQTDALLGASTVPTP
ncbi:MAG: hypothetical protein AAF085_04210, partial [Planctomycetota bacterium]